MEKLQQGYTNHRPVEEMAMMVCVVHVSANLSDKYINKLN